MVTDIGRGRGECGGGVREKGERKEEWRERKGRMPTVRGNKNGSVNVRAHVRQPLKSYDTHSMLSLEEKNDGTGKKAGYRYCQLIKLEIL